MYDREMWGQVKDVRLIEDVLELFLEYLSNSLIWTAEFMLTYCWASRERLEIWQTIFLCQELKLQDTKLAYTAFGPCFCKKECPLKYVQEDSW